MSFNEQQITGRWIIVHHPLSKLSRSWKPMDIQKNGYDRNTSSDRKGQQQQQQLNLPSLYSRRKIKHILLAHSIYHQYAPPHILQLNLPPLTTPIYSPRCQRSYHIPSSRIDRHKDSPVHKSLHLFNLLPEDIKNTHDRTLFKSQISALLTNSVCSCSHHLPYSP